MSESLSLSGLPIGAAATVIAVDAAEPLGTRLRDLGLHPGTKVICLRRAPLGDPRIYELRGVQLCLRGSEARKVRVSADD
ncbi:MAG: ferrous iron transport protein A [bacterium]|nr:ferrous iron transport protein A [bacterium]MCP5068068.1 ferrous iron transport protein A [bacterium]